MQGVGYASATVGVAGVKRKTAANRTPAEAFASNTVVENDVYKLVVIKRQRLGRSSCATDMVVESGAKRKVATFL